MTTVEILKAAKAKIEDPARWCQRFGAKNLQGGPVSAYASSAVCWCALGALWSVGEVTSELSPEDILLTHSARALFDLPVSTVNDRLGHAAVMQMYDKAIELAQAEEVGA